MEITAALAADLASLSETLDERDADIHEGLRRLAADVASAVRSYLGLTVVVDNGTSPVRFLAMEDSADAADVVSSLALPLWDESAGAARTRVVVVLYAGRSGAFVDLAADLCWLTGRPLADFALDEHLDLLAEPDTDCGMQAASAVNQAIGVLLGHGYTPEQADLEIDALAAAAGHSRSDAADIILGDAPSEHANSTLRAR